MAPEIQEDTMDGVDATEGPGLGCEDVMFSDLRWKLIEKHQLRNV